MGSTPRGSEDPRRLVATLVQYPKWRTESRPDLLNRVNGVYNRVTQLSNLFYPGSSVVEQWLDKPLVASSTLASGTKQLNAPVAQTTG